MNLSSRRIQKNPANILQRNILGGSEDFTNASYWSSSNITITTNTTNGPFNGTTADTCDVTASCYLRQPSISVIPCENYVFSFYALRGTATDHKLSVYDESNAAFIINARSYFLNTSANEWRRIVVPFQTPTGCKLGRVYPLNSADTGTTFLWGAQLVRGTWPGPYQAT